MRGEENEGRKGEVIREVKRGEEKRIERRRRVCQ